MAMLIEKTANESRVIDCDLKTGSIFELVCVLGLRSRLLHPLLPSMIPDP